MSKIVLGFHYILKDANGDILDRSRDDSGNGHPLLILLGVGQIIPGLERQIMDLNIGDVATIKVKACEAYGDIDPSLRLKIPRDQFPADANIVEGLKFQGDMKEGYPIVFTVIQVEDGLIFADGNHDLAGQDLFYDIEIVEKRTASDEEIAHGHAHGVGGHQH